MDISTDGRVISCSLLLLRVSRPICACTRSIAKAPVLRVGSSRVPSRFLLVGATEPTTVVVGRLFVTLLIRQSVGQGPGEAKDSSYYSWFFFHPREKVCRKPLPDSYYSWYRCVRPCSYNRYRYSLYVLA